MNKPVIPSVDYLIWAPCNMRCQYCFATFNDLEKLFVAKNQLSKEQSLKLIDEIAKAGFQKITILGGEPTICPWLIDVVKRAKMNGIVTCIVTNGTLLTKQYLDRFQNTLDWITLSIDSLDEDKLRKIGRTVNGVPITQERYKELTDLIHESGIKLKVNTVVSKITVNDDMVDFIALVRPKRWKLLQVLPMQGQNDILVEKFLITKDEYYEFVKRNSRVKSLGVEYVVVENDSMPGSYVLIDPLGRLIDTTDGKYEYGESILKVGMKRALKAYRVDINKYRRRGGKEEWL